jgi:hypothetical protein
VILEIDFRIGKRTVGFGAVEIDNDSFPLTPPSPLRRGRNCVELLEGFISFGSIQREAWLGKCVCFGN